MKNKNNHSSQKKSKSVGRTADIPKMEKVNANTPEDSRGSRRDESGSLRGNPALQGMIKAIMMKEALASCQMEGIGLDLTIEDLYLEELKNE